MKKNNCIRINNITLIAVVLLFGLIIVKLLYVATSKKVDGINLKEFALSRTTANKTITANRGTIYDVSGEILAQDVRSYTVIAYLAKSRTTDPEDPQHVVDKQMTAEALSPLINMSVKSILNLLNNDLYQVELGPGGRGITELVKQEIEALNLPGIDFIKSSKRDYPNGDFASYLVGYAVKKDNGNIVGELGIEGKYDEELRGTNGSIKYQKDAYGYKIANTPEVIEEAKDGYDIYLTIDTNIQMYLENAVKEIGDIGASWTTITIANANDGSIVGSASIPSYNPNKLNIKDYNNPLVSYSYEPGSTMKIYSFMASMEEGKYNGSAKYNSGSIKVSDYTISDWNKNGWGTISYDTGFTYSSNVAAVLLSKKLGKSKLLEYYEKFGFGTKTGIELANEYDGKLEFVYDTEIASASYGQGMIMTTPIQNIQALTSITNKGIVLKPFIVSKIIDPSTGKIVYEGKRTELGRAVSENTVNQIIELMDKTVNTNDPVATGKKYSTPAVRVIGKTGTAQYALPSGKYASGSNKNIRSFAGVFPKDNPEYIIYFSVKDFQGTSSKMGEIVKSVIESIAKYKNMDSRKSDTDSSKVIKLNNYINNDTKEITRELKTYGLTPIVIGNGETIIKQYPNKDTSVLSGSKVFLLTNSDTYNMPNVIGFSRSELISFANLMKLKYTIDGYGVVTNTSILPGTDIKPGNEIKVTLGGFIDNGKEEKTEDIKEGED